MNNKVSFQNNIQPFDKWAASVSLTLTVNDTAGTSPGGLPLSYIDPLKFTGTSFSFNASPLLYQTRTRTYVQNYTINIGKIPRGLNCVNSKIQNNGFNLEGNLGLKDQIYMGLHSFSSADKGADFYQPTVGNSKSLDDFGATVSFHIFKGVSNVGPTWTLQTFKGPTAGVGYTRDDLHQIIMTFAPSVLPAPIQHVPPLPAKPKQEANKDGKFTEFSLNTKFQIEMNDYNAKIARRNAIISENAAAESIPYDAAANARGANQILILTQSIQNLGQVSARP